MKVFLAAFAALLPLAPAPFAQGYQSLIDTWVAEDALDPPPANALLFVGSSSIRKWERLQLDFASYDVIQRGFGGSTIGDLNQFVDEIVLPYDPYAIVLYSGGNAIVSNGATAAQEFVRYENFVDLVHSGQNQMRPPIPIYLIGITPAPARWPFWPELSALNDLLATFCQSDASLCFIDTPPAFLATGSPPSPSLFAPDGVHLNEAGYALWTSQILPVVSTLTPSPRVYVQNPLALAPGERLLYDFGANSPPGSVPTASPDTNGNWWNNWPDIGGNFVVAGEHTGNLITTTGRATGIGLVLAGGFQAGGIGNGGLAAPSPLLLEDFAIESATQDFFGCVNLTTPLTPPSEFDEPGFLVFNHLDRRWHYEVKLFASRDGASSQNTVFTGLGHPTTLALGQVETSGPTSGTTGSQNDDTVVTLSGLRTNFWGQLFLDVAVVESTGMAYLNALEVRAVEAPLPPLSPGQKRKISAPVPK